MPDDKRTEREALYNDVLTCAMTYYRAEKAYREIGSEFPKKIDYLSFEEYEAAAYALLETDWPARNDAAMNGTFAAREALYTACAALDAARNGDAK